MGAVTSSARRFRGKRCVVTGGLGFIGSNVVHALHRAGAQVTVVDALVPTHGGDLRNVSALADVQVVRARIDEIDVIGPAIRNAEVVFNLAGQVSHLASMDDPIADLDLNARSHLALLELLRFDNPGAVVVHSSTRQVYGRPRYLPVDEEHPTQPVDINGIAKLAGEQAHLLYARVHDMPITSLRLTNVYGPRQNLQRDGLGFLPVFVRKALQGEMIELYGDGQQLRDCLHVDDVVEGLLLAASTPSASGEVFNLGHPDAITLHDVAVTLIETTGRGSVQLVPWPADHERIDIGSFHGDFTKARNKLGWQPTIDFATGARSTVAFYQEHEWYLSST
jgi:UDP-glucose 4-epimerase